MKKTILSLLALLMPTLMAGQVALKTDGLDSAYVQNIVKRSQKIVDGLAIDDAAKAEAVRNIIANRYFLLNQIHEQCAKSKKFAKDSVTAPGKRQHIIEGAERRRDAELYKHHFELASALSYYIDDAKIDAVKDGITFGRLKRDYQANLDMIPSLKDDEKAQILIWLKEAREFAMDAGNSKEKHAWFDKYRGRTNNWLSSRGYDLKKERENWTRRIEEQKAKAK